MAKRKIRKAPKPPIVLLEEDDDALRLDPDAVTCLGATLYDVREAVIETASRRAKGKNPIPLTAMKQALLEHGLGWALVDPKKAEKAVTKKQQDAE